MALIGLRFLITYANVVKYRYGARSALRTIRGYAQVKNVPIVHRTLLKKAPKTKINRKHKLLWDTLTPEQQIALITEINPQIQMPPPSRKRAHS